MWDKWNSINVSVELQKALNSQTVVQNTISDGPTTKWFSSIVAGGKNKSSKGRPGKKTQGVSDDDDDIAYKNEKHDFDDGKRILLMIQIKLSQFSLLFVGVDGAADSKTFGKRNLFRIHLFFSSFSRPKCVALALEKSNEIINSIV